MRQVSQLNLAQKMREDWIDRVKFFGMVLIVWGHCFPEAVEAFVYAFSVPVFFFMSGYLTRLSKAGDHFWRKLWRSLIVPYLILCSLKALGFWLHHVFDGGALWSMGAILTGFHSIDGVLAGGKTVSGAGNMWFVYSLVVIKIVFHYACSNKTGVWLMLVAALAGIIFLPVVPRWAVSNAVVAMPFFLAGHLLSPASCAPLKKATDKLKQPGHEAGLLLGGTLLLVLVAITSRANGTAWMFKGEHGCSVVLFLVGGFAGSLAVCVFSLLLRAMRGVLVSMVGIGSLIILCFHRDLIHAPLKWIESLSLSPAAYAAATALLAVAAVLLFVPVVMLVRRYAPIVIGGR